MDITILNIRPKKCPLFNEWVSLNPEGTHHKGTSFRSGFQIVSKVIVAIEKPVCASKVLTKGGYSPLTK